MFSRRAEQRILIKRRRKRLSFPFFFLKRGKKNKQPRVKDEQTLRKHKQTGSEEDEPRSVRPIGGAEGLSMDVEPSIRRDAAALPSTDRSESSPGDGKMKTLLRRSHQVLLRCRKFRPKGTAGDLWRS